MISLKFRIFSHLTRLLAPMRDKRTLVFKRNIALGILNCHVKSTRRYRDNLRGVRVLHVVVNTIPESASLISPVKPIRQIEARCKQAYGRSVNKQKVDAIVIGRVTA